MKEKLCILFCYLLIISIPCISYAQFGNLSAVPPGNDYCPAQWVTLSVVNPPAGNNYTWIAEGQNNFSNMGSIDTIPIGTGPSIQVYPGMFGPCVRIIGFEFDANFQPTGIKYYYLLAANSGNTIPIYIEESACFRLNVPDVYQIYYVNGRWAMWYKDGIATGITSPYLDSPTTGNYQYKLKLACGDTLKTDILSYTNFLLDPVINISGPSTVCNGDTVLLSATNPFNYYQWFRDGITISGATGSNYKATVSGRYQFSGSTTTPGGYQCWRLSPEAFITVQSGAFITASDTARCFGDSILLQCTAANSYSWKRNGVAIANGNTQSIYVKTGGDYQVITTGLICNTSKIKHVNIYSNPTVSLLSSGQLSFCNGNGVTLTTNTTNTSKYQWTKGNANIPGATSSSIYITKNGTYRCIAYNAIGCAKTSAPLTASINTTGNLPTKTVILQPGSNGTDAYVESGQYGGYFNFGNSPVMEISNWYKNFRIAGHGLLKFDLNGIPTGVPIISATLKLYIDSLAAWNNVNQVMLIKRIVSSWSESSAVWPTTSDYLSITVPHDSIKKSTITNVPFKDVVSLWTSDPIQNNGISISEIEFPAIPALIRIASSDNSIASHRPKLSITYSYADINANGSTTFCNGDSVILSTNTGAFTYQWYKNNVAISAATGSNYAAKTSGDYFVSITNGTGCSVASAIKHITVTSLPTATITPLGPTTFCNGDSVKLQANNGAGLNYQWLKTGTPIPNAILSLYSAKTSGFYKVQITNSSGCSKTSSGIQVNVPCRASDIITNQQISIYPNPSSEGFTIIIDKSNPIYNLKIFDALGKMMEEYPSLESGTVLGTNWPKGVYIIQTENPIIIRKQIIKL